MRIISKNHDYYDGVQRMGQDMSVLYVRKESDVVLDYTVYNFDRPEDFGDMNARLFVVGFCGRVVPCIKLSYYSGCSEKKVFCYACGDVRKFADKVLNKKQLEQFYKKEKNRRYINSYNGFNRICNMFDIYQKPRYSSRKVIDYRGLFEQYGCPVYVVDHTANTIYLNCELKKYEFYRIVDAYTAFQTIYQWQANIAQPEKPMPVISDSLKIQSHGFDKYSFRKDKTK